MSLQSSRAARHRQHRPGVSPPEIFRRRKMNFLRYTLIGFVALILVLALIGWYKPSFFEIQRVKLFRAKPEQIYAQAQSAAQWAAWHPWIDKTRPGYSQELSGPESGPGSALKWRSDDGSGTLTLKACEPGQRVEFGLVLDGMPCSGLLALEPLGEVTRVRMDFRGDVGGDLVLRYLLPVYEKTLGRSLAISLDQLAARVETAPDGKK